MQLLLPRIYVYKITFLEVPHYYYGVHLEKKYNEYYMGSPKTNKDFWEFYTPMKEIIKEFPLTDDAWIEAQIFEDELIEPVYNTDPLCLNAHCGGKISLKARRDSGRRLYEQRGGMHGRTKEQIVENARKAGRLGGLKTKENKSGFFAITQEERRERKIGFFSIPLEKRKENGKRGGQKTYENGSGIFKMTPEQKSERSRKNGKKTSSQKWQCTVTGYVSTPGPLSLYQKARGIDTKNRIRLQ